MYKDFLKLIAIILAIVSFYLAYTISGIFLLLSIGAYLIYLLSKHFDNQEIANAHLDNIEDLLKKIYLHTIISDDDQDDDEENVEDEKPDEYVEPWVDYNKNKDKPIIKM